MLFYPCEVHFFESAEFIVAGVFIINLLLKVSVYDQCKPKDEIDDSDDPVYDDYNLVAYSKFRVDYEYIVALIQGFVDSLVPNEVNKDEFEKTIKALREEIKRYAGDNPKRGAILSQVVDDIEADWEPFQGKDISVIINEMRYEAANREIEKFAKKWYLDKEFVQYEAYNYRNGELANENKLKDNADYGAYKEGTADALPKFKFRKMMVDEFRDVLMVEIGPLID